MFLPVSFVTAFNRRNYLSDIAYLTYNWDPVLPFLGMKVNWQINKELLLESGAGPCKKIYMDFGIPFAGIKLSGEHADTGVYSFGEDSAFLINAFTKDSYEKYDDVKSKILIKIMKLFVPHGLLNIRICPRCQNSFFIFPEDLRNLNFKDIARLLVSRVPKLRRALRIFSSNCDVLMEYKKEVYAIPKTALRSTSWLSHAF